MTSFSLSGSAMRESAPVSSSIWSFETRKRDKACCFGA